MAKRTLPDGACCARCGRRFTSVGRYRFDPLLDHLAVCRGDCSMLPYSARPRAKGVPGRIKVPGGVWEEAFAS